jgi:methylase of polypeptide subunit release factors
MVNEWRQEVIRTFELFQQHTQPYVTKAVGLDIIVLPGVFSPHYATDSAWYAERLPKIVGSGTLLEIGTGTGLLALVAALNGASVTATDINPEAVQNAQTNFTMHGIEGRLIQGNMYEPFDTTDKFDVVVWNHPFNDVAPPEADVLWRAGFDQDYEGLEQYIAGAEKHLNPNGRLLLGSGTGANTARIKELSKQYGYKLEIIDEENMPMTDGSSVENGYVLYELVIK